MGTKVFLVGPGHRCFVMTRAEWNAGKMGGATDHVTKEESLFDLENCICDPAFASEVNETWRIYAEAGWYAFVKGGSVLFIHRDAVLRTHDAAGVAEGYMDKAKSKAMIGKNAEREMKMVNRLLPSGVEARLVKHDDFGCWYIEVTYDAVVRPHSTLPVRIAHSAEVMYERQADGTVKCRKNQWGEVDP